LFYKKRGYYVKNCAWKKGNTVEHSSVSERKQEKGGRKQEISHLASGRKEAAAAGKEETGKKAAGKYLTWRAVGKKRQRQGKETGKTRQGNISLGERQERSGSGRERGNRKKRRQEAGKYLTWRAAGKKRQRQ
jgi:hypothetical protein